MNYSFENYNLLFSYKSRYDLNMYVVVSSIYSEYMLYSEYIWLIYIYKIFKCYIYSEYTCVYQVYIRVYIRVYKSIRVYI